MINIGVQVFQRNNSRFAGTECIFRIVQDGVLNLLPYMTKRVIRTKSLKAFKSFISQRYNGSASSFMPENKETANEVAELAPGCFVLVLEGLEGGSVEALTMHKFEHALSTMICRENIWSLQLRYLTKEERDESRGILDAENKQELKDCIDEEKIYKRENGFLE